MAGVDLLCFEESLLRPSDQDMIAEDYQGLLVGVEELFGMRRLNDEITRLFRVTGIDPKLRGEMLGITDFAALAGAGRPD